MADLVVRTVPDDAVVVAPSASVAKTTGAAVAKAGMSTSVKLGIFAAFAAVCVIAGLAAGLGVEKSKSDGSTASAASEDSDSPSVGGNVRATDFYRIEKLDLPKPGFKTSGADVTMSADGE